MAGAYLQFLYFFFILKVKKSLIFWNILLNIFCVDWFVIEWRELISNFLFFSILKVHNKFNIFESFDEFIFCRLICNTVAAAYRNIFSILDTFGNHHLFTVGNVIQLTNLFCYIFYQLCLISSENWEEKLCEIIEKEFLTQVVGLKFVL